MTGGFEVDADRLARHAGEFEDLTVRAGRVAADLQAALDATGTPWGGDAVGRSFHSSHAAPAGETLERLHGLADGLRGVGERFGGAASAYRAGDADAASGITGVTGAGEAR